MKILFFSNIFQNIFCSYYLNIFISHLFSIIANKYYCQLFVLRVSSLLSSLIDASGEIFDNKDSCKFSPEAGFTSPLYVPTTLVTDTEAESMHFAQLLSQPTF